MSDTEHDHNDTREQLAEHLRLHPDTSPIEAVAAVGASPTEWVDHVADALEAENPVETLRNGKTNRKEADSSAVEEKTPTPEPDIIASSSEEENANPDTDREAAVAALDEAISWFNSQLDAEISDHTETGTHPDRPTTAREYFRRRGWADDTIDTMRLGWAPASRTALLDHLMGEGFGRGAILGTGLFTDDLRPIWSGRYVLPYFDAEGEPAYAIARCTGSKGGGAAGYDGHPADGLAGKYAKLRHTDDRVPFDEPIWGHHTLSEGEEVVVAEGIADAITAAEAGYAVLSPVAKEFKEAHYAPLADALEAHDIERVTIIGDADNIRNGRADAPESIADAVSETLSPVGAGLAGALRTATKLGDRTDADIRLALPPAPGDVENDLDEFVAGVWRGDLAALLRSAKPPRAFQQLDSVLSARENPADAFDDFDSEEYEPTATDADETTDEIRDIFAALDSLDAREVAENTIVAEWLDSQNTDHRTFRPTWAPSDYTGTAVYCDSDKFVDTGSRGGYGGPAVMAAIDAGLVSDTQCPEGVSDEKWFNAVDHLRGLGFSIPELGSADTTDHRTDPRERVATVDMRRAWEAAGRVTPDDLEGGLSLAPTADEEAWLTPDGERIGDVVRAIAVDSGVIDSADAQLAEYATVYNRAREEYGAPLPRYYTTADAIAEFDAVTDVVAETTFFDLAVDALNSDITAEGDAVGGEAVRALNPTWRPSESEASVLVFESGTIWDADTERVIDTLRFVALDSGLIESPEEPLAGEVFTDAYARARSQYGAPLPSWEPADDGTRQVTPQLPPAEELVDTFDYDGGDEEILSDTRAEVEQLTRELTADADDPTVITSLPATGKTTAAIKTAHDRPLSYLAPRKDLQKQALEKADRWNVDAEVLPVFCDKQVREGIIEAAITHVREAGKSRLRDRWAVLTTALSAVGESADETPDVEELFVEPEPDEEEVDLDRPTCETARGDHGPAWALTVHVARAMGYTPREIHQQAEGLFGAPLPCDSEEATCDYSDGWNRVTDADNPADLLVGSYVHAHVESVRTHYDRTGDGMIDRTPRAVVIDEFPGEAFVREFGEEAVDHATWLARSLSDHVADRRDMRAADLHTDEWVTAWLNGNGADVLPTTIRTLERFAALFEAREAAEEILGTVGKETLRKLSLADPLNAVVYTDPVDAFDDLAGAIDAVDADQRTAGIARWVDEAVREPLRRATADGTAIPSVDAIDESTLPDDGDLRGLVDRAIEAVTDGRSNAERAVKAAITGLRGGREGCRRLAAWADDGYAHPDAHHLLKADITPTEGGPGDAEHTSTPGRRLHTDEWAFDEAATDGTVLDHVETGAKSRVVADRNDHGALLHTPPSRESGGGGTVPIVGLDATGRRELWSNALGESVNTADVHDNPAERAEFLESALGLRVIQAADRPRPYEGDPTTKDTEGDIALLQELADEYAGVTGPRTRKSEVDTVGKPACITTKGVRELLEADSRLADTVAEWENYGNITGANNLGEHRLGAILGSQHFGDHAIERFCALAGEEVDTSREAGRGVDLDYGNDLANTYLKHMREDQTMQAILRFARGDSGATVVARTSALRNDLPVVGEGQVVETWSDTATTIARAYRRLGGEFTISDVADTVDVTKRQVRRVLTELSEAGYLQPVDSGIGRATVYEPANQCEPGSGEVSLPDRPDAVAEEREGGHSPANEYYTWNVRVSPLGEAEPPSDSARRPQPIGAPPAPSAVGGGSTPT